MTDQRENPESDLPPAPREIPPFYAGVILWGRSGDILLQQRDDIPGIAHPGMVGTFGGGGMEGEAAEEAAIREIKEETNLDLEPADLRLLMRTENRYQGGHVIPVHMFGAVDVPDHDLHITEGQLFRAAPESLDQIPKITPSTLEASRRLVALIREGVSPPV